MLKKIIAILCVFITSMLLTAYSYAIRCPKCVELWKKGTGHNFYYYAWRDFSIPHLHKDGKIYATYRCEAGHTNLVEIGEEK